MFFIFRWEEIIENRDPDGKTAVDEMIQNCPEAVTVRKPPQFTTNQAYLVCFDHMIPKHFTNKFRNIFQVIMDNCIESTGDFPDSIDYTQKLDFRFIDPGPDDVMCKRQRYFAFEVTFKVE